MIKKILFSFVINIFGMGSMLLLDFYISTHLNTNLISEWALLKSVLFIGVFFVLVGLDQAIVRKKTNLFSVFLSISMHLIFLSVIISFLFYLFDIVKYPFLFIIIFFLFSFIYILYAFYRVQLNFIISQLIFHSWKVFMLYFVVLNFFTNIYYSIIFSLSIPVIIFLLKNFNKIKFEFDIKKYKDLLEIGIHYFFSMLSLSLTLYIDQILLHSVNRIKEAATLFSHITFFVSPIAIIIGFLGFVLTPYLRNNIEKRREFFYKYIKYYFILGFIVIIFAFFIERQLFFYFKGEKYFNFLVALLLMVVVYLRILYVAPSVYIGSFATNNIIKKINFYNYLGIFIYVGIFYIGWFYFSEYSLYFILIGSILTWIIKNIAGFYGMKEVLKMKDEDI
jgi:O-antigen/teichoic acid export membrane protein